MAYRTDPHDRAKSLGLVVAVHVALGLALVAGLRGPQLIQAAREHLTAIDVRLPPPPPPARAPDKPQPDAAKDKEGASDRAAKPAPVVVPVAAPAPSPVPVAREVAPVAGSAPDAGAGTVDGEGRGAGAAGSGNGGGGSDGGGGGGGGGGQAVGARWLGGGLSRGDYRAIRSFAVPTGSAAYAIRVDPYGRAVGCRPRQSSGSPDLDAMICDMLVPRLRFEPARDPLGRPRPDEVTYVANWSRR